ncbi:CDP-diacylglycerol--serine O-phosphatidyltransferase [Psychromarinibacter sp. C21-152]|uniref:CDP-diacylglycerol--serine O-phosphatidyltransferase n=1 Tax=Psychromarinibacter sediminicola TaxID=3033385 RepID=A0AAE3TAA7_9RHOB|nr:CDP-diacylglycerol--serine O-phosphatidyltransferase [Psychromarinibacter sediminicola]MDF0603485.1 CDP-diacylglycerol--serine O-phosphatidyltransferase [Psychromarinibacter sediminicola]
MPRLRPETGDLPLVKLLPNLVTLAAVCAGMTAILFASEGAYQWAVRMILIAGVLDGLDGRLARLMRVQSPMGAELDSLADALNFGVAPGLILYFWSLHTIGGVGWIAVLCFALCCIMRLARFNVDSRAAEEMPLGEPKADGYFTGVPSPAGAVLALFPMMLSFALSDAPVVPALVTAIWIVGVGVLMISRIPTWSFKNVSVARANARFALLGAGLLVAALIIYTWATLILLTLAYVGGVAWGLRGRLRPGRKE